MVGGRPHCAVFIDTHSAVYENDLFFLYCIDLAFFLHLPSLVIAVIVCNYSVFLLIIYWDNVFMIGGYVSLVYIDRHHRLVLVVA